MQKAIVFQAVQILINDLLNTSSSSSEEDEFDIIFKPKKTHYRSKNFIHDVQNFSEEEFKENFRVTRETAEYIAELYRRSSFYKERMYQGGKKQLSAAIHVLSFLWFSSNKNGFREVCDIFNISLSNFSRIFRSVLHFLTEELASKTIRFPKTELAKRVVADDFEKISGFPNVLGCIDESYISIRTPKNETKSNSTSRHDMTSITIQAICDSKKKFLNVYTGTPSKGHDSRIFNLSTTSKEIPSICGSRYHLLGDAAYPLREYLLTPYRDCAELENSEKEYNYRFCQTRMVIQNAIGLLKSRFRQLVHLDFHNVETMSQFIVACCVLHNLCIDRNDIWIPEFFETNPVTSVIHRESKRSLLLKLGEKKRNIIRRSFC